MGSFESVRLGSHRRVERVRIPPGKQLYSTSFPLTENPISEGGIWLNGGADGNNQWANVSTTPNKAIGESRSDRDFADPTAIIKPDFKLFAPNQAAQGVVSSQNQTGAIIQEVELRLRSAIAPDVNSGYEIYWRCLGNDANAYYAVTRWNGAYNDFTTILLVHGTDLGGRLDVGVVNGDVIRAEIEDATISLYKNGLLVDTVLDSTYPEGQPGFGMYVSPGAVASKGDFGLSSFFAEDL